MEEASQATLRFDTSKHVKELIVSGTQRGEIGPPVEYVQPQCHKHCLQLVLPVATFHGVLFCQKVIETLSHRSRA